MHVIIYLEYINEIGGIETWVYNLCSQLFPYYRLSVLYKEAAVSQLLRLADVAELIRWDSKTQYECDVLINNTNWRPTPNNIKYNKKYTMIHSDYNYTKNVLDVHLAPTDGEYLSVTQFAADQLFDVYGIRATAIEGLFAKQSVTHRILHLVSATRLSREKGWERMKMLMSELRRANIRFDWRLFTTSQVPDEPELIKMEPTLDIMDYLADADYVVQLSDTESLCCTVREALMCGTPVIVTDIPAFHDLIQDGYNGYKLPLDMNEVPVRNIYEHIPNDFKYTEDTKGLLKQWTDAIGKPSATKLKKPVHLPMKVRALIDYYDVELGRYVKTGEEFEVSYKRGLVLTHPDKNRGRVCEERG